MPQTDSMYRPPAVLWPCHDNHVAGCWLAHLCDAKHHWLPRAPCFTSATLLNNCRTGQLPEFGQLT